MCSPYFYPGTVVEIISTEGAGILVALDPHEFELNWAEKQAFTVREVHPDQCVCGRCGNELQCADPRHAIVERDALIADLRSRLALP